jgi:hypothetical protein
MPKSKVTIHPSAWKGNSANFACTPLLGDSVSYVEVHKPIDVYIRNIIPLGMRLPRRRSCGLWAGAMLNFAIIEFYEVRALACNIA